MNEQIAVTARVLNVPGLEGDNLLTLLMMVDLEGVELFEYYPVIASTQAPKKLWKMVGNASQVLSILASLATIGEFEKPDSLPPVVNVHVDNAGQNNIFVFGGENTSMQDIVKQKDDSLAQLKMQLDIEQMKKDIEKMRSSPLYRKLK